MSYEPAYRSLADLAAAARDVVVRLEGDERLPLSGVAYDSRRVRPGDLFCCVVGTTTDGHLHAAEAIARGAAALCVERPLDLGVPQIVVRDGRRALARVAAGFFGRPADGLLLLGVTGTNGKTTTAYLLESILAADGRVTGLIGTVETRVAEHVRPGVRTTPESLDLQRLFFDMREAGVTAVAMEVTSHGLVLHRVEEVRFAAVAFTNLTQDHLDFHPTMDDYFAAKRSLFTPERAEKAAANVDDPYGRRVKDGSGVPCIGFGTSPDAEVRGEEIELGPRSTVMTIRTPKGDMRVTTRLVGHFNVANCLAAAATALQGGIGLGVIERGITELISVPGRFESIDAGQPFSVIVDYAHTPDSLHNVLAAARPLAASQGGRVVCAFGCGGDRDRGKRPLMGAVAARLADVVVVTSDNPRSEDPGAIIGAILEGVVAERADGPDFVLPDRREAIVAAVGLARTGDVVVIAGKGHEDYQELATQTIPFDDREVAREALAATGWDAGA